MRTTGGMTMAFGLGIGLALLVGALAGGAGVWAQEDSSMTVTQTEETMAGYAEALFGGGDYQTFFADDVVMTMTGVDQEIWGPEAARAAIDTMHQEQFAAQIEVTTLVVGAGQAALEAVFVGTHTGEWAGIAATGREVTVPYGVFYELEDGKITALRIYALAEGLVEQLQA